APITSVAAGPLTSSVPFSTATSPVASTPGSGRLTGGGAAEAAVTRRAANGTEGLHRRDARLMGRSQRAGVGGRVAGGGRDGRGRQARFSQPAGRLSSAEQARTRRIFSHAPRTAPRPGCPIQKNENGEAVRPAPHRNSLHTVSTGRAPVRWVRL